MIYYLLERNDFHGPIMWVAKPGEGFRGWVTDAAGALRFATEREAEAARLEQLNAHRLRVTEHQDVGS